MPLSTPLDPDGTRRPEPGGAGLSLRAAASGGRVRAFCPHCNTSLADHHDTSSAARCEACRLLIGPGRALSSPPAGRQGGIGGASGRLANAALREGAEPIARAVVEAALRQVAAHLGVVTERLRLFDYEQVQQANEWLPRIAVVLSTSGSWKRARTAAASRQETEPAT